MITRRTSIPVNVGGVTVGGSAPVVVQSMTNTDTADIDASVAQVASLARAGSEIVRLTELSVKCCERVKDAVGLLDNIGEARTAEAALKTCEEIDRLESDADRVMRNAMSKLFREEPDVREVIKLKAIYELLETVTDKCEDVANLIEGIVLENA